MDLMKLGAQMLLSKMAGGNDNNAMSALSSLLGDGKGGLDLGSLVGRMQNGGTDLAGLAASWLGNGKNQAIDINQLRHLLGNEKISQFARQLGTDEDTALNGLSDALPNMVDKASPNGSLLDSFGGVGGLMGMASKFLR
jgi:uncharacterized protein YidB (DUF937 family)